MPRRRVWLSRWEWACCGEPFTVGEHVTFMTDPPVDPWVADQLGPVLAESIDAIESHHEDGGSDRVPGVVLSIEGVALRHIERRIPREQLGRPSRDSPSEYRSQNGWIARAAPDPGYVVSSEPIPGSATLHSLSRVPWPPRENERNVELVDAVRGLTGYLVDVEVQTVQP